MKSIPPLQERIFVQVASFRDPDCQWTVKDIFDKAAHPERVFIGICWQFDAEEDVQCFIEPYPRPGQVRVFECHYSESGGMNWARSTAQSLWQGEEYVLQIDSHMRFAPGWDETLIRMLKACRNPKAVISTMLPNFDPPDERFDCKDEVTYTQVAGMGAGALSHHVHLTGGFRKQNSVTAGPFPGAIWVGNFNFTRAATHRDVPLDPYIYFYGDEISMSARLFTHGYDIYQPNEVVAYHCWVKPQAKGKRESYKSDREQKQILTNQRMLHLLGIKPAQDMAALLDLQQYAFGNERTLADYWEYSGVDMPHGRLMEKAVKGAWGHYIPAGKALPCGMRRIFVQIASYRDVECQWTLKDLFEKADYPERVFAGVYWQVEPAADQDCFMVPYLYPDQVREIKVEAKDATGMGAARAGAQSLWAGEDYTLQIDAHMRFAPGWDSALIEMLHRCDSEKALISASLPNYAPPSELEDCKEDITHILCHGFDEEGMPQIHLHGGFIHQRDVDKPFPSALAVGNFLFGPSAAWMEVQIDPHIYFKGYELSYSARLYTHGWDIYQPDRIVAYHQWERENAKPQLYKAAGQDAKTQTSYARVYHLLNVKASKDALALADLALYALGWQRSLEEFRQFSGIDMQARTIESFAIDGKWPHHQPHDKKAVNG